ncbi:IS110 family transposase [Mucilaginibacter flavus]|uniref:IS110 family transposase n=1 Tax=Mucilaginibacter flavus TaxID=931504 RepID=UPI0025B3BDFB|nr:transposase [Mucilaginibacter flavus]MDN3584392.1 transposase [Mucilaginibacter flavus]
MPDSSPITKKVKKYTHFIGLDVSKHELDFAVFEEKTFLFHKEIKNEKQTILDFIGRLKEIPSFKLSKAVFCMENTGFYGNHFLNILIKLKANIIQEHPLKIKKSMGTSRGKDDKSDAIRIADFAWKNRSELKLWVPRRPVLIELSDLMAYRNRLLGVAVILKNPEKEKQDYINAPAHKKMVEIYKASLEAITKDLSHLEEKIKLLIAKDERLTRLLEIITSVPFIGFITAVNIIICTNEYRDITNPKKFACYAGIAPFPYESGTVVRRRRVSPMANKKMKALLHLCAIGAATRDEELKDYFKRKVSEGKHKLSVFNAVRYKLVLRVFACLKQDRLFIKPYQREGMAAIGDTIQLEGAQTNQATGEVNAFLS